MQCWKTVVVFFFEKKLLENSDFVVGTTPHICCHLGSVWFGVKNGGENFKD